MNLWSLFKAEPLPPPKQPAADPNPNCKHLNAVARATDMMCHSWCPECQALVRWDVLFNNWTGELRRLVGEVNAASTDRR